jgi:hemin uptake protein HemP
MNIPTDRGRTNTAGRSCEAAVSPRSDVNEQRPGVECAQRRIRSEELLGRAQQIEILHRGQSYRLRLTSLGKLILTK